jgi:hypothetical protein
MATKAGILATINGFITSVITQAKHRSSMSTVVDEIYPVYVEDNNVTETYTTKSGAIINYKLNIVKSGNIAHVSGNVINASGIFQNPQQIFTWKENQFKPKADAVLTVIFKATNSTDDVRLQLNSTGLAIASGEFMNPATFNFEFITYITQD